MPGSERPPDLRVNDFILGIGQANKDNKLSLKKIVLRRRDRGQGTGFSPSGSARASSWSRFRATRNARR